MTGILFLLVLLVLRFLLVLPFFLWCCWVFGGGGFSGLVTVNYGYGSSKSAHEMGNVSLDPGKVGKETLLHRPGTRRL